MTIAGAGELAPSRDQVRRLYLRAFSGPPLNEGEREAELFSPLYARALARPDTIVAFSRRGGRSSESKRSTRP